MPKGNRTNHPPRAGVEIKKPKGGRNKRTFWITEQDLAKLKAHAEENKKSLNDALSEAIGKLPS